ncbi:MAG: type II toxin-antitoxin system RelE/ParE family toxin [Desulfuromonadaceae bacterium]|nr:type II toxin-antitoxin system RelE/ParE family toxin [Desulfuromonadaceae bacterium]
MVWNIEIKPAADKALDKLDIQVARRILKFLHTRIALLENPRSIGEALSGPLGDYWKYRVGDYRVICDIQDNTITILVLAIGDRKQVYRRKS